MVCLSLGRVIGGLPLARVSGLPLGRVNVGLSLVCIGGLPLGRVIVGLSLVRVGGLPLVRVGGLPFGRVGGLPLGRVGGLPLGRVGGLPLGRDGVVLIISSNSFSFGKLRSMYVCRCVSIFVFLRRKYSTRHVGASSYIFSAVCHVSAYVVNPFHLHFIHNVFSSCVCPTIFCR